MNYYIMILIEIKSVAGKPYKKEDLAFYLKYFLPYDN
jgi:hypothetical protein